MGSRDVSTQGRRKSTLAEFGKYFLPYGAACKINMVHVHGIGILWAQRPQPGNRSPQKTQHASYSLKIAQGGRFFLEGRYEVWVQWKALTKGYGCAFLQTILGQIVFVGIPQASIGGCYLLCPCFIHMVKQPAPQHLDGFVFFCGIQQGGFAGRNTFSLAHHVYDSLIFLAICVNGFLVFFPNGQRKN